MDRIQPFLNELEREAKKGQATMIAAIIRDNVTGLRSAIEELTGAPEPARKGRAVEKEQRLMDAYERSDESISIITAAGVPHQARVIQWRVFEKTSPLGKQRGLETLVVYLAASGRPQQVTFRALLQEGKKPRHVCSRSEWKIAQNRQDLLRRLISRTHPDKDRDVNPKIFQVAKEELDALRGR
jgi:hypothetical protein